MSSDPDLCAGDAIMDMIGMLINLEKFSVTKCNEKNAMLMFMNDSGG